MAAQRDDDVKSMDYVAELLRWADPTCEASMTFDLGTGHRAVRLKLAGDVEGVFEIERNRAYWSRVGELADPAAFPEGAARHPIFKRFTTWSSHDALVLTLFLAGRDLATLAVLLVNAERETEAGPALAHSVRIRELLQGQVSAPTSKGEQWRATAQQLAFALVPFQAAAETSLKLG